jgi:hypothetical protein
MSDRVSATLETRSFSMDGDGKFLGPACPLKAREFLSLIGSLQIPAFDRRDEQAVD